MYVLLYIKYIFITHKYCHMYVFQCVNSPPACHEGDAAVDPSVLHE